MQNLMVLSQWYMKGNTAMQSQGKNLKGKTGGEASMLWLTLVVFGSKTTETLFINILIQSKQ